jgi:hypothetical protein
MGLRRPRFGCTANRILCGLFPLTVAAPALHTVLSRQERDIRNPGHCDIRSRRRRVDVRAGTEPFRWAASDRFASPAPAAATSPACAPAIH